MSDYCHDNCWSGANIGFQLFRYTAMPFIKPMSFPIGKPPVVIGGMGDSGTRDIARILKQAGFWMGSRVNAQTEDAMAPRLLLEKAFIHLVREGDEADAKWVGLFSKLIQAHRQGMPDEDGLWGWKNPRAMWIIPFLSRVYPELKFIHVVKDGRDIAISEDRRLLKRYGYSLLDDREERQQEMARQFRLWAVGNMRAWEDGKKYLGDNYMVVNYETLCSNPCEQLPRIFRHCGITCNEQLVDDAKQHLHEGRTGLWRNNENLMFHHPNKEVKDALKLFGYL